MAELDQSGLFIAALMTLVTQAWPVAREFPGCSDASLLGITQLTAGNVPAAAAPKNLAELWTLPSWPSSCTVRNPGSGFQMPGVNGDGSSGAHVIAPVTQSGSVPGVT